MRSPVVARTKDSRLNPPLTLRRLVAPKGPGPLPRRSSFFEGSKAALLAWAVVLALIIGSCLWYLTTVQMDSPTPVPTFRDYSSILNGSDYYLSLKGVSCPDGQPLIRFEVEECRALAAYFGGSFEGEVVEKYRPGTCYRKNDYWFVNLQPTNFLSSPRSQDEVPCLLLEDYPIYHSSFQPSNYFLSPVGMSCPGDQPLDVFSEQACHQLAQYFGGTYNGIVTGPGRPATCYRYKASQNWYTNLKLTETRSIPRPTDEVPCLRTFFHGDEFKPSNYYLSNQTCSGGLLRFSEKKCQELAAFFEGEFDRKVSASGRPATCYRRNGRWYVNLQVTNTLTEAREGDEVPCLQHFSTIQFDPSNYYLSPKGESCSSGQLLRFTEEQCKILARYYNGTFLRKVYEDGKPATCYKKNGYWFVNLKLYNTLPSPRNTDEVVCLKSQTTFNVDNFYLTGEKCPNGKYIRFTEDQCKQLAEKYGEEYVKISSNPLKPPTCYRYIDTGSLVGKKWFLKLNADETEPNLEKMEIPCLKFTSDFNPLDYYLPRPGQRCKGPLIRFSEKECQDLSIHFGGQFTPLVSEAERPATCFRVNGSKWYVNVANTNTLSEPRMIDEVPCLRTETEKPTSMPTLKPTIHKKPVPKEYIYCSRENKKHVQTIYILAKNPKYEISFVWEVDKTLLTHVNEPFIKEIRRAVNAIYVLFQFKFDWPQLETTKEARIFLFQNQIEFDNCVQGLKIATSGAFYSNNFLFIPWQKYTVENRCKSQPCAKAHLQKVLIHELAHYIFAQGAYASFGNSGFLNEGQAVAMTNLRQDYGDPWWNMYLLPSDERCEPEIKSHVNSIRPLSVLLRLTYYQRRSLFRAGYPQGYALFYFLLQTKPALARAVMMNYKLRPNVRTPLFDLLNQNYKIDGIVVGIEILEQNWIAWIKESRKKIYYSDVRVNSNLLYSLDFLRRKELEKGGEAEQYFIE